MPSLEGEHPTDDQLHTYLTECCIWLHGEPPPRGSDVPWGETWHLGASELHCWIYDVEWQALKRLDLVPRVDALWSGTNMRPTLPKLHGFCDRILGRDPDDIPALRTRAALAGHYCPMEFAVADWVRLWRLGHLDARLGLSAALWCDINCGRTLGDALSKEGGFIDACTRWIPTLQGARTEHIRLFASSLQQ